MFAVLKKLFLLSASDLLDIAVGTVLGLVMFGVGLSLSYKDFTIILRRPRAFLSALAAQMIGLPIIAFIICLIAPLPAELAACLLNPNGSRFFLSPASYAFSRTRQ